MLGKTNITAIESGTIISDIEEYRWEPIKIDGVDSDFVKAIYGNDMLVAIMKDGTIAYTMDGENWEKVRLGLEGDYELTDIIWTGSNYVMVGNQKEIVMDNYGGAYEQYKYHGMVVTTENLTKFSIEQDEYNDYSRYYAIIEKNGMRIIISKHYKVGKANAGIYSVIKSSSGVINKKIAECYLDFTDYTGDHGIRACYYLNKYEVIVVKKISGGVVYVKDHYGSKNNVTAIYDTTNWADYLGLRTTMSDSNPKTSLYSIFECKDSIFVYVSSDNHLFYKTMGDRERTLICQGISFLFVDAIYFNKCEIFLNSHSMIIVRSGESMADKSLDDLIDITYDFDIKFIEKAFDKLYIFGTGGNILVSNDEIKDEEAIAVKTMSAAKALYDAKAYADKQYASLEDRIIALENKT